MKTTKISLTILILFCANMYRSEGDLLAADTNCKNGTDPYCLTCSSVNGKEGCHLCAASFIDKDTLKCKTPSQTIDHCGSYNSSDQKCFECQKGFFLSSDGFCVEHKLEGCVDPLDQAQCRECDNFMIKEDKTCDMSKPCSIEGCSTCEMKDGKEICVRCKGEFVLSLKENEESTQTCVESKAELEGCSLVKNENCISCKFGYYVNSKLSEQMKCTKSPAYESQMIVNFAFAFLLSFLLTKN